MNLEDLLQRADLWRGGTTPPISGLPSGFAALDAELPGGGWPQSALTEILIERTGIGELRLLLPALARLTHEDRWVAFVAPPFIPYAPALLRAGVNFDHVLVIHARDGKDVLWAVEQALRAGTCGAVLAWQTAAEMKRLRRLQLAAEAGHALGVLFRSAETARESSPAALRLKLDPAARGLAVHILKRRGGWPTGPIILEVNRALALRASARSSARNLSARPSRI
ncbi:MAG: translesion DNA synthesis-associated protein ImuA [Gammaproteobacteria bacterium]|nr:translesion DNA synthesis-associated protein ImuA [Gammaproteobacteria bacterium]